MAENIVQQEISGLVDQWLQAERDGVAFPVPFDAAWAIAGYSRKDSAKRKLENPNSGLVQGEDFCLHISVESDNHAGLKPQEKAGNAKTEKISMTCDAFKQFCLMAKTEQGKATRLYFIEAEKRWKLVQQIAPEVASEVEVLQMRIELAKLESQKAAAEAQRSSTDLQLVQFRHYITTALPEPVQQKVLGYTEVKSVEYRDRIIVNDDIINDGSTILKTELCHRYGLLTRNGKADYKRLGSYLEKLPSEAFTTSVRIQENNELRREYLKQLDRIVDQGSRQLWQGE